LSKYYRSANGKTVHRDFCDRIGKTALPWHWAEERSDRVIAMYVQRFGMTPCKLCCPYLLHHAPHLRVIEGE
jgi:hypothetical protein